MNFIEWTSQIKQMYDPNAALATHRNNWINQGLENNFRSDFREVSEKLFNKFFFSVISSVTGLCRYYLLEK